MEELVADGLVKNIGCSNVGVAMLRDVMTYAKVKPTVLQVEIHPYHSQEKLVRFCQEKDISVTGYSSLGASSYVEMGMGATIQMSCLTEPCVEEIAAALKKTPA